jgi:multiple sugar transport system substrate-binding protein
LEKETEMTSIHDKLSRRDAVKLLGAGSLGLGFGGNAPPSASARQATPDTGLRGEITVWYFPFGPGVEELYAQFAEEFGREYPGIRVNLELQPWADRYPKMLTAIAAGEGPDVMYMTGDPLIRFAEAGALAPLDDLLPADAWVGYSEQWLEQVSFEGARWYLPIDIQVPVWLYNKALMEQIGRDPEQPPTSWDDLRQICEQTKALNEPDLWVFGYNAASSTLNTTFYPFLYQAGGRPFGDGGCPTFNGAAGVEALEFIVDMFDQGCISPEYLTPIDDPLQDPFFRGRQIVSAQLDQSDVVRAREVPDLEWGLMPVLKHKEQWGAGALESWAISAKSEHKEAAAAWLGFLTRPEAMLRHNEAFGSIPPKEEVAARAFADDPVFTALQGNLPYTFDEQKHRFGRDIMPLVIPQIQAAILKQKSAQEALDDAAAAVNELIGGTC